MNAFSAAVVLLPLLLGPVVADDRLSCVRRRDRAMHAQLPIHRPVACVPPKLPLTWS